MKLVRSQDTVRVFEDALRPRADAHQLIEDAERAARRGDLARLDECLESLASFAPRDLQLLADELHAIVRCVGRHPARGALKAG